MHCSLVAHAFVPACRMTIRPYPVRPVHFSFRDPSFSFLARIRKHGNTRVTAPMRSMSLPGTNLSRINIPRINAFLPRSRKIFLIPR